jgi:hypothetical protein
VIGVAVGVVVVVGIAMRMPLRMWTARARVRRGLG